MSINLARATDSIRSVPWKGPLAARVWGSKGINVRTVATLPTRTAPPA